VTTDIGSDPTVSAWTCIFEVESYAGGYMIVAQSFQGVPKVWRNRECVFPESAENRGHEDGGFIIWLKFWVYADILQSLFYVCISCGNVHH
jgi:hypothetical protein